jgi:hypothetical protein
MNLTQRWLLLTLLSAITVAGCAYASHGGMAQQLVAVIALTLVQYCLLAWLALDKTFDALRAHYALTTTITISIIALLALPLLEDDHFRYLWDGYITATTGKPFAYAPSHYFDNTAVPGAMREVLSGINNPDVPTIYGPVLQALFALCYWVAPAALWPFKVLLLGAQILVLLLLRAGGVSARGLMLFTLHPLLLKESALTAHPDLLIGAALLAAVLAWQRGREGWAASLACIAVAMKFSALAVLPFFCISRSGRWSARGSVAAVATLAALYAPALLTLSGAEGRALSVFGEQWTFNPLLFKWVALLFGDTSARWLVLVAFAVIWLALALHWRSRLRHGATMLPPVVAVFVAMLLLSPVVNPWYWLWVLPLATLQFSPLAWVAASASLLAYAHFVTPVLAGSAIVTYAVPLWAGTAQLLAILLVVAYRHVRQIEPKLFKFN